MSSSSRPRPDLVVIGASAGGVETLRTVVSALPADLQAAVCIVLHISPTSPSLLAGILARAGRLPCHPARDGDELQAGKILVAPPDHHLVVEDGRVRLTAGPRENGHRPAVDVLFRSASSVYDGRVLGLVLSGTRDDGAAGLALIKANGGLAVVQDPADALYPGMPANALAAVTADAVASSAKLGDVVAAFVAGRPLPSGVDGREPGEDPPVDEHELITICPECGGVLTEDNEAGVPRWRCHVGHIYSSETVADEQGSAVEAALWTSVRMLSDREALLTRLAEQAEKRGRTYAAGTFRERAAEAREHAAAVREVLESANVTTLRRPSDPTTNDQETAA